VLKSGVTNGSICIDREVLLFLGVVHVNVVVCEGVDGTCTSLIVVLDAKRCNDEFFFRSR